jgi:hypothetical protein
VSTNLALRQQEIVEVVFEDKPVSDYMFRARLEILEAVLKDVPGVTLRDDERTPLTHLFAPGLYARKIEIPAYYVLTTGIHATEHIAVISKGSCLVATPEGVVRYEAGDTIITKIGTKRAIFVLEDLVWTTVHNIDASTPEEAINMIEYKSWEDLPCLSG